MSILCALSFTYWGIKMSNTDEIFYCYVLMDSSKPGSFTYGPYKFSHEPIYVGKGKEQRSASHIKEALKTNPDGTYKYTSHKVKRIRKILRSGHTILIKHSRNLGTEDKAFAREIHMIDTIGRRVPRDGVAGPLTNGTRGGAGAAGRIMSEKTKQLIREARALQVITDETRAKISKAQIGVPKPAVSLANTGRKATPEHRKAISDGQRGNKRSAQACENNRIAQLNRRVPTAMQVEQKRLKQSKATKGIPKSADHRAKIGAAQKGRQPTEQARANQRLGQQRRWENYRLRKEGFLV